jgi:hypothetical protein
LSVRFVGLQIELGSQRLQLFECHIGGPRHGILDEFDDGELVFPVRD